MNLEPAGLIAFTVIGAAFVALAIFAIQAFASRRLMGKDEPVVARKAVPAKAAQPKPTLSLQVCPNGHQKAGNPRFCDECGASMASAPKIAYRDVSPSVATAKASTPPTPTPTKAATRDVPRLPVSTAPSPTVPSVQRQYVDAFSKAGPPRESGISKLRAKLPRSKALWAVIAAVAVLGIAEVVQNNSSGGSKLTVAEKNFIARVKAARAAQPGSPMAEAHPETLNEHLSWRWPDDETLVSEGRALCAEQRKRPYLIATNQTDDLPFLTYYRVSQRDALWYSAAETLCPDLGVEQYFRN